MTLFLITAPSGAGKTTICKQVGIWSECVSHTTRPKRVGELEGITYYYVSKDEFKDMENDELFVESVEYDGNKYGLSVSELNSRLSSGRKNAYVIVEHDGYKQIKEKYPNAVGIFIHMSKEDCMANMLLRGDSVESASRRIEKYDEEIANRIDYDYVIKNVRNKQHNTVNLIKEIIMAHIK